MTYPGYAGMSIGDLSAARKEGRRVRLKRDLAQIQQALKHFPTADERSKLEEERDKIMRQIDELPATS